MIVQPSEIKVIFATLVDDFLKLFNQLLVKCYPIYVNTKYYVL